MGRFEALDILYFGRFGAGTFWGWDLLYLDVLSLDVLSLDVLSLDVLSLDVLSLDVLYVHQGIEYISSFFLNKQFRKGGN